MLATQLDPAPHGLIVLRAACVERDEQPDRKRDGPGGPVQDVRRLGQNFRHGSTEAQSKKDAAKDCDDGPARPHILLRRHVSNRGFTLGGLGLHPRLAWANGVIEIALSPVLWRWTGWDLNPGLPACKAGDLPLIYRPRRAHSVAAQMKLSARIRGPTGLNAYPLPGDEGAVDRAAERALRWFVGLSLLAGGLVLLAGAIQFGTLGGPIWVIPLAGVVAAVLAILTGATEGGPRSPILPASAWIVSAVLGILWARLDSVGPAFLNGYPAGVSVGPGFWTFRRQFGGRPRP